MGGTSDRQKQAQTIQGQLGGYINQIGNTDTNVQNRFDGWSPEFGYERMAQQLDEILKNQMGEVNKQTNFGIQQSQSDLAERLASTGGAPSSIAESQNQRIRSDANRNRSSLLAQLLGQNQQGKLGAMSEANRWNFAGTQGAQNVDLTNMQNLFRKYGLMGSGYGMQLSNVGNFDNTTWLDDVFAGLNTLAGFVPLAPGSDSGNRKEEE